MLSSEGISLPFAAAVCCRALSGACAFACVGRGPSGLLEFPHSIPFASGYRVTQRGSRARALLLQIDPGTIYTLLWRMLLRHLFRVRTRTSLSGRHMLLRMMFGSPCRQARRSRARLPRRNLSISARSGVRRRSSQMRGRRRAVVCSVAPCRGATGSLLFGMPFLGRVCLGRYKMT